MNQKFIFPKSSPKSQTNYLPCNTVTTNTPLLISMHTMLTQNEAMGAATASDAGTCAHSLILGKNYDVMHKY